MYKLLFFFFFQAEDGIRDKLVTGVQTCALPISTSAASDLSGICRRRNSPAIRWIPCPACELHSRPRCSSRPRIVQDLDVLDLHRFLWPTVAPVALAATGARPLGNLVRRPL